MWQKFLRVFFCGPLENCTLTVAYWTLSPSWTQNFKFSVLTSSWLIGLYYQPPFFSVVTCGYHASNQSNWFEKSICNRNPSHIQISPGTYLLQTLLSNGLGIAFNCLLSSIGKIDYAPHFAGVFVFHLTFQQESGLFSRCFCYSLLFR